MEGLTRLLEIGKDLGLSGEKLLEFIDKERESEEMKEKERLERESVKEEIRIEREEKKELDKIEREERHKEREMKKKELELLHEENLSKLKLQLADKEIELAEIKKGTLDIKGKHIDIKAKLPKLPAFCEGKDNMDSYLKRFDRFAENAKWPREEWATNLATLLQGKALDVYSRLSSTDAVVYDTLKESLLKSYQLTEEGFRIKLRTSKQESCETASQFMVRLESYLTRWMDLSKVDKTFEGLKDLILREQFLAVSGKQLVMFLKERKLKSVSEMSQIAK